jgi:hypothetical protein
VKREKIREVEKAETQQRCWWSSPHGDDLRDKRDIWGGSEGKIKYDQGGNGDTVTVSWRSR